MSDSMLEIAQHFEQVAVRFRPIVLIGPGLAAVLLGLFVWLGGLGFRKPLVAVVGAVAGGICGFFTAGRNIMPAVVAAAAGAALALIFEKVFITILAAGLAAVFGFAVLAGLYKADFSAGLKHACLQMPAHSWAIIAALAAIFITAGFYIWRFISALCCAALGTLLVFVGMILLLLYKGAAPASSICSRTSFYIAVFVVMTAFGTIEQLLLAQRHRKQPMGKKETDKGKEKPDEASLNWRTR